MGFFSGFELRHQCFRLYSYVYGNATRDYNLWNTEDFLNNLNIEIAEFSLHVLDGEQFSVGVKEIVGHPNYSA